MKDSLILIVFFISSILIGSCSSTKNTTSDSDNIPILKSTDNLLSLIDENSMRPDWFSARTNIQYKTNKSNQTVNVQLRLRRDSAIWISITPLFGIEVARVLITPDSVKYLDRFNKQYSAQSIKALRSYIPIEGNFNTLQNIILGNYFSYSEKTTPITVLSKKNYFVLSSLDKKQIKAVINKDEQIVKDQQNVWITGNNYRISRQLIIDQTINHAINLEYSDFEETHFGWFPKKTSMQINSDNQISIVLKHTKIQNNKYKDLPFSVPSSYETIN